MGFSPGKNAGVVCHSLLQWTTVWFFFFFGPRFITLEALLFSWETIDFHQFSTETLGYLSSGSHGADGEDSVASAAGCSWPGRRQGRLGGLGKQRTRRVGALGSSFLAIVWPRGTEQPARMGLHPGAVFMEAATRPGQQRLRGNQHQREKAPGPSSSCSNGH